MLASLRFRVSCRCSDHYLQHIGGLEKGYPSVVVAVFMNPGVALCFFLELIAIAESVDFGSFRMPDLR